MEEGQVRRTLLAGWVAADAAVQLRQALASRLDFSKVRGETSSPDDETIVYRKQEGLVKEHQPATAPWRHPKSEPRYVPTTYWPARNWVLYIFAGLLLVAYGSMLLISVRLGGDLIPGMVVWSPAVLLALWMTSVALNTAVIMTETHLILQNWLRLRRKIAWDSIAAVYWIPRMFGAYATYGAMSGLVYTLELDVIAASGRIRRMRIAGGYAGKECARNIRDAVISRLDLPVEPIARQVAPGSYGEEFIWRVE